VPESNIEFPKNHNHVQWQTSLPAYVSMRVMLPLHQCNRDTYLPQHNVQLHTYVGACVATYVSACYNISNSLLVVLAT